MNLTLYFGPGACSFIPHVMLEASGHAYEPHLVKLHKGEQRDAEFLKLNPNGQVPVLVHDGQAITQIVAIALHLDGLFPDKGFLPAKGLARTRALELLAWMNNTMHATFTHVFMPGKFTSDEAAQASIKATAQAQYAKLLSRLQEQVDERLSSGQPWLAGDHIGPLDAYVLTLLRWGTIAGINPEHYPTMWAFVQRVAAEPAVARVIERERLVLNLYKPA